MYLKICLRLALPAVLVAGWLGSAGIAVAEDDEARDLYIKICSKCHGSIAEDAVSSSDQGLLHYVVTMPLGPDLSDIFGREAGIYEGYPYSPSFQEIATGWKWDEETLDLWLTSSQDFARGSTMFLRVKSEEDRATIIGYLKKYAQNKG